MRMAGQVSLLLPSCNEAAVRRPKHAAAPALARGVHLPGQTLPRGGIYFQDKSAVVETARPPRSLHCSGSWRPVTMLQGHRGHHQGGVLVRPEAAPGRGKLAGPWLSEMSK